LACLASSSPAFAQKKPLRVSMTLSEIPKTSSQPNGGFEGYRFTGYTIYDATAEVFASASSRC
jgi:peptide/nickel transport system substrate-binding protein